ncbi:hypothetical protein [Tenacibaculum finnmarkense]|uniref:hypothetical protein n=2 Tax=Tenacibaculum finnmarkense TaxID=2781243 RepID=UPI00187B659B|nr:hypothetical protein [Tenacibaculum finnmarkense]MBE7648653.1 hypothetical protein [Tenacibaculum finnmarkense genomovar ulcerans]MCD8409367.1 hypothetical protein [Tenacibaculum finnmarkense genomovar ulcerans]MCD8418835.1 hypothetical protein [Tenacibaculum finnmarkense genomovar finnmarkense]MCG8203711.1 hypothetical protein [Tenacibaculum finnmarkense genomovar finnmarkense]MCG8223927.1 hypothetical protein [Tenacibaculum finnmarkense genomovar finnmarkense]
MKPEKMIEELHSKFSISSLKDAIFDQSNFRTSNIEELTESELKALYYLFFPSEKTITIEEELKRMETQQMLKRLRSMILKDAQCIGLYKPDDWQKFNAFMKNKSVLKKPLNSYEVCEFPALIIQFKSMRHKFEKSKTKVGTADWYNFIGIKPSVN